MLAIIQIPGCITGDSDEMLEIKKNECIIFWDLTNKTLMV